MRAGIRVAGVAFAALLAVAPAATYERQLTSYELREAYFLGKDTTFRYTEFAKDYVQALPVPPRGVHIARIEISTPFKQVVSRARQAPDGYTPMQAESDYRQQPPRLGVEVTLLLTPTFPGHTPYSLSFPTYGPIYFRDPDFWREFEVKLVQQGEIDPLSRSAQPLYNCTFEGGCWLVGAVVRLDYDADQVASRPVRILVASPDGQQVQAEFDLARLR